uniref:Brevinin-1TR1 antimicrobial peptide n=1 Tax=Amolops torrentis TaxID=110105 RepID=E7EKK1_9NEOB|nr:brevinin-1TR1 antimicrobial peptide precursor [Amolops torrentis]
MFTTKKPMLLLFFLGTINFSLCEQERDAEEERRDDQDKRDVEVEKRFFLPLLGAAAQVLPSLICKIFKKC